MNKVMLKIELMEKLERHLRIELDRAQLQFILSDKCRSMYTTPRRCGKDTMIAARIAINAVANPNKRYLVVSVTKASQRFILDKVVEYLDILTVNSGVIVQSVDSGGKIMLNNGTVINFMSSQNFRLQVCGMRIHEVIINEYMHNDLLDVFNLSCMLTVDYANGKVFMVGTPYSSNTFRELAESIYIEHVQVLNRHVPRMQSLLELRNEIDEDSFRREILGEIF